MSEDRRARLERLLSQKSSTWTDGDRQFIEEMHETDKSALDDWQSGKAGVERPEGVEWDEMDNPQR